MSTSARPRRDRRGAVYTPAVGPRLRPLLWVLLIGFALLGANGVYLASVTALTWWQGTTQQTFFYMLMILVHLALGFAIVVPFLAFGVAHLATSYKRPNKAAVRYGIALLACATVILLSGLVLVRMGWFEVRDPSVRLVGYWLHVASPLAAVGLYVAHRLAGPRVRWEWSRRFGLAVAGFVAAMALLHSQDPRTYGVKGPKDGEQYFFPSSAVTANGKFIPPETLMMDDYCLKCHKDAYDGWFHSSHHFSSFNNKAYLSSVRETRQVSLKRDGDTKAARWCAGCHDPVPFFSGEFDDPNYDDVNAKSSQAGITCTACHSITNVNSTRGNADYTIEEPEHYPFASSENAVLQWVNNTLVKAKPEMHKKTFLKPAIKQAEFCSTCHKVSIPYALNHYKDFLRGQNHWDTFLLSGVSGHGAKSFYYPPAAKNRCVDCHMNFVASGDFGARDFDGKGGREIHNHLFPGANTGLATLLGDKAMLKAHETYLKDNKVRVDLFALREGGEVDGALLGPLRPGVPALEPGKPYLVEVVVRTLGLGHPFSQGTVDSNEIWVELVAKAGGKVVGRSGGVGDDGTVDPYAHFINVYMLDRDGNRVDRRNPQDIFTPLYNKQIPPGAGQVVHFRLDLPPGLKAPVTLEANVNYRKFDRKYFDHVFGKGGGPKLPVVAMASDALTLPVEGGEGVKNPPSPIKEEWQRWNDYGIGLLLEGSEKGGEKGELKQAEPAFRKVAEMGKVDGWVNLTRVYFREGRIPEAEAALAKAAGHKEAAAPWVINWLAGQINDRNGLLDDAIARYEAVLSTKIPDRGFDFGMDYEVNNALALSLYNRAFKETLNSPKRTEFLTRTIATYRRTLELDSENVAAHYGLGLAYDKLAADTWRVLNPPAHRDKAQDATTEGILLYARRAADATLPPDQQSENGFRVASAIDTLVVAPHLPKESRLEPVYEVVTALGRAWAAETRPVIRASIGEALASAHKGLHKLLKEDESARGRAIANARTASDAADRNAQSIVIHPMNRPGAPGIDRAGDAPAEARARTERPSNREGGDEE